MREVASDVFCAEGTDVNWVLVREGTDLTLIDAGWPGDIPKLEASVRAIRRRPEDIRGVLLTHAHVDHMGALGHLHARYGIPVYLDPAELGAAAGGRLEQASPLDVLARLWRPQVLAWGLRILGAGALRRPSVPHAQPFPSAGPLDLPGRPVPVPCHGHTSGHSAYFLPGAGAVATGDALTTADPTTRRTGPQILSPFFAHAPARVPAALDTLAALAADTLIPGHGPTWHGPLADAVALARTGAGAGAGAGAANGRA
ncbi:MBL fold metallo-hydrolase [Kitasatospora sp. NPDC058965]|uniref:MBL fold metallo-hydrolase n=1 Tax=Kitasatospora sp. NPDC058965 TaxID=3346682 RepID=UPI003683CF9C